MISVIGRESIPALPRSLPYWSMTAFGALASPISPMKKPGWAGLGRGDGIEMRADLVGRLVDLTADLELDERGAPVLRDLIRVARGRAASGRSDVGLARDAGDDVVDGRVECGRARPGGAALDQDVLGRRPLEVGVQDRSIRPRLSGPLPCLGSGFFVPTIPADPEGDDHQDQQPKVAVLPVGRTPATHSGCQVARAVGGCAGRHLVFSSCVDDPTDAKSEPPQVAVAKSDSRCDLPTISRGTSRRSRLLLR
jgi:hypothetical protein